MMKIQYADSTDFSVIFDYDENGDMIYESQTRTNSVPFSFTYRYLSYDNVGNWLTSVYSTTRGEDAFQYYLERDITYR